MNNLSSRQSNHMTKSTFRQMNTNMNEYMIQSKTPDKGMAMASQKT